MSVTLGTGAPTSALPVPKGWAEASLNVCVVLSILSALAVIGRFYVRRLQRTRPGVDDWLVLAALVIYWAQAIVAGLAIPYGGIGYHVDVLETERKQYLLKLLFVLRTLYALPLALTKASICFFLLRIFTIKRWFRIGAYSAIVWSVCFVLLNVLGSLLACAPIAANWNYSIPGARCTNVEGIVIAIAVVDVLIDLAIILLPMPIIFTLQMSVRDKMLLTALLSLGLFDALAGVLRVATSVDLDLRTDYTFGMRKLWFWSELEPGLAICVACLIVMRPLLERLNRTRQSFHSRTRSSTESPDLGWVEAEKLRARSAVTTVKATGDPFDVELAKLDQDYDLYQVDSRDTNPFSPRTGGAIVVSREVLIISEDRQDRPTPVI